MTEVSLMSSQVGIPAFICLYNTPKVLPISTPKAGLLVLISDYRGIIVWSETRGPTSPYLDSIPASEVVIIKDNV